MRFDDIHGTDWRFRAPDGREEVFEYSGWGCSKKDRDIAERFEREHPEWKKTVESF